MALTLPQYCFRMLPSRPKTRSAMRQESQRTWEALPQSVLLQDVTEPAKGLLGHAAGIKAHLGGSASVMAHLRHPPPIRGSTKIETG